MPLSVNFTKLMYVGLVFSVAGVSFDLDSSSLEAPICGSSAKHNAVPKKQSATINRVVLFFIRLIERDFHFPSIFLCLQGDQRCPFIVPLEFTVTIGHMKKIVSTNEAPAAIGPYSQAVRSGRFLFCSGQIPLDPKSGEVVSGDVTAQTKRVMENIAAVLKAEGLSFNNVVKTTIFLTNLGDFQTVNEIYGSYFKNDPPARSTVQVAALPRGVSVEIEMIAASSDTEQTAYDTSG